jgi:23S rRNA (uracil1939-C5)-methyltransferase
MSPNPRSRPHHGGSSRPRGKAPRTAPSALARAGRVEALRIDHIAAGGAGVAKLASGAVVFVPGAAPGELVEAEVNLATKPARGKVLRVLEPSAERVEAPCGVVAACGGCDFMHLSASAQRAAHADIVRRALSHATSLADLPAVKAHEAPSPLEYRTRARLLARARGGRVSVGYRAAGSHDLVAVEACLVLDPAIAPAIADLPAVLRGATGEGDVLLSRGAGRRPVVEILWRGELAATTWTAIDERVSQGAWAGARVTFSGATRPAAFGDPRAWMDGADGEPLVIAPGGFAQTSDAGASALARRVAELARLEHGDGMSAAAPRPLHTVELFAGSGTLSVLLARQAASFTAVEIGEEAAACARENFAARGISAKVVVADADAYAIPQRAELVVLDPPRAGAPGAARAIASAGPRLVVYVACDPATLARDVAVLTGAGYAPTDIETFELFPQTSHVEAVVRLVKRRASRAT